MSLFDILRCHYPLPDPHYQDQEFQTKDLGQSLALFTITAEGRLTRQERTVGLLLPLEDLGGKTRRPETSLSRLRQRRRRGITPVDLSFHGDVRFYFTNDAREFIEYVARFTHGTVERIERLEKPVALPMPSLSELAEVVETAAWAYGNVLTDCFEELHRLDPDLAAAAVETLGNEERAARWFGLAHRELSGTAPYQAAANGRRQDVLKILNSIDHGIPG